MLSKSADVTMRLTWHNTIVRNVKNQVFSQFDNRFLGISEGGINNKKNFAWIHFKKYFYSKYTFKSIFKPFCIVLDYKPIYLFCLLQISLLFWEQLFKKISFYYAIHNVYLLLQINQISLSCLWNLVKEEHIRGANDTHGFLLFCELQYTLSKVPSTGYHLPEISSEKKSWKT